MEKVKILIIDDSDMNREVLADMLSDEYDVLQAANGDEGERLIAENSDELSLILLDLIMPVSDGYDVLEYMKRNNYTGIIPVIIISVDNDAESIHRSFDLGASDFITRPFDEFLVKKRLKNTISLYFRQKKLVNIVSEQIYEREKDNNLMINILSHVVEFRNSDSGQHIINIHEITEILLLELMSRTDKYGLTAEDAVMIANASALHDIGKISVPDHILNKPGKYTPAEYEVMKTHSASGAEMIAQITPNHEEKFLRIAYEICRWHHERFDGKGYPDGLVGDDIPVSAQVVSIADVYDDLTGDRIYKKAVSHEKALEMITSGECGAFNPLIIECLTACSDKITAAINDPDSADSKKKNYIMNSAEILTKEILGK